MSKKIDWKLLTFAIVLTALIVCGSLWDLKIAKAVYFGGKPSENIFGVFFAFVGIVPTFVGWSFLGASILCLSKKSVSSKKKRGWLIALSVLLFVLSFFFFCNTLMMVNEGAFSVHWAIAYPVGIAVLLLAAFAGYRLSQKSENARLLRTVLYLTLVSLITMILVMTTKEIMDRPRFRFLVKTGKTEYFRQWWQSGSNLKASLKASAVSDEFSSFPSGHSAYAAFAVFLFPALADFIPKLEKRKSFLFLGGVVWWVLTAFSRLTVGAHYLSDVSIAGLVTVTVCAALDLVWKRRNE